MNTKTLDSSHRIPPNRNHQFTQVYLATDGPPPQSSGSHGTALKAPSVAFPRAFGYHLGTVAVEYHAKYTALVLPHK